MFRLKKILSCLLFITIGMVNLFSVNPVKSKFINFDKMKIHYLFKDNDNEKTIVFIHGWACDSSFWQYQINSIDNFKIIAIDLPGYGKSDKKKISYTIELDVEILNAVIKKENVQNIYLVSHSMGHAIARQYALKYPNNYKAFCNIDGMYFKVPKDIESYNTWKKQNEDYFTSLTGTSGKEVRKSVINSLFSESTTEILRKEIMTKMLNTPDHVTLSSLVNVVEAKYWQDEIINKPTLIIYAKNESLAADNEAYMKALYPTNSYYEIANTGHFLMMEKPSEINNILLNFLNNN